nr:uncharacterized protein LOC112006991 [Quercus suber]
MKILGWNYRGIYNAATVRALKAHVKGNSLDIIFLSETKASVERMKEVLKAIKFADMCVVEAKGIAGGICVMWRLGLSIHQMKYNKNLIALKVANALCDWLLVCIGDFNFTINDKEILRGNKRGESSATNFLKELIFEFGAIDLGFSGNTFMWAKDHTPILLDTNLEDCFAHRLFRFEVAKIRDNGCNSIVEEAWNDETRGPAFSKLYKKQAKTRVALRKWNKEVLGHCQVRINLLMDKISEVQKRPPAEENGRIEEELQVELSEWLLRSEILWKQKSRELWLKEGDRNTKFFHLSTIIRRRQNNIDAIKTEEGCWVTNSNQIRQLFYSSFKSLFTEECVNFPEHLDNLLTSCITEEENSMLKKVPTREEIKETLFQMQNLKSSWP